MISGLYLDSSTLFSYGGNTQLGAILAVLGLNLYRCQILLRQPHSDALHANAIPHVPQAYVVNIVKLCRRI